MHERLPQLQIPSNAIDHPKRSLGKAISWRIVATSVTVAIVYVVSGQVLISLGAGAVEATSKMLLYYFHERAWNRVSFGKQFLETVSQTPPQQTAPVRPQKWHLPFEGDRKLGNRIRRLLNE